MPVFRRRSHDSPSEPIVENDGIDPRVRWSRTIGALGESAWQKLRSASVLQFGAGRTGSLMADVLVKLGVRKLDLVDHDTLGVENLDAMFGVTEANVGRPKAVVLAESLHRMRSDCVITAIPRSVNHALIVDRARGCDLIVTCVDSDTPRLAAALLANRFLKVHLDVGTAVRGSEATDVSPSSAAPQIAADIRLLLPHQGCVVCVGGLRNMARAFAELDHPPDALPMYLPIDWRRERAGSLVTINAIAVGASQAWLDLLTGHLRTSFWQRLRWVPGDGLRTESAHVGGAANCQVCAVRS